MRNFEAENVLVSPWRYDRFAVNMWITNTQSNSYQDGIMGHSMMAPCWAHCHYHHLIVAPGHQKGVHPGLCMGNYYKSYMARICVCWSVCEIFIILIFDVRNTYAKTSSASPQRCTTLLWKLSISPECDGIRSKAS